MIGNRLIGHKINIGYFSQSNSQLIVQALMILFSLKKNGSKQYFKNDNFTKNIEIFVNKTSYHLLRGCCYLCEFQYWIISYISYWFVWDKCV